MDRDWLRHRLGGLCNLKYIKRRVPILKWIPTYNCNYCIGDFIAGVTVGLTVIPQGIAYGDLAGLPVQYGLYTSFMGCFVYLICGSVRQITVGPTAIMAIMVSHYVKRGGPEYAALLSFLSGIIMALLGALNFGVLVDLVSVPVISGFVTAASLIIVTSQIKNLLGLNFHADGFIDEWTMIVDHFGEVNEWDCILGVSCILVLLLLKKTGECRFIHIGSDSSWTRKAGMACFRLLTTSRNIIIVFSTILLAFLLEEDNLFTLTGSVQSGLPPFSVPSFSIHIGNSTLAFMELVKDMGSSLIVIPLIAILETISIAKVFARGRTIDASQEMIALGLSNFLGSFVSAFPAAGSFSRTAVNAASGVCTPMGGVWTGTIVIIALLFLAPCFAYIPRAALAAIIISAVIFMTEFGEALHIFRTRRVETLTWTLTFLCCLFLGIELGILIGVGFNILLLIHHNARPKVVLRNYQHEHAEYLVAKLDRSVHFPSVEYVRSAVTKIGRTHEISAVVLDMSSVADIDFTAVKGLSALTRDLAELHIDVIITNLECSVMQILRSYQCPDILYCRSLPEVPSILEKIGEGRSNSLPAAVSNASSSSGSEEHLEGVSNVSFVV